MFLRGRFNKRRLCKFSREMATWALGLMMLLWPKASARAEQDATAESQTNSSHSLLSVKPQTPAEIEAYIRQGADINERDPDGRTALHVHCRDIRWVRLLLANGADPTLTDKTGNTALHCTRRGFTIPAQAAEQLINAGANINAQNSDGQTPLHLAIWNFETAELLLNHGAMVNIPDRNGDTPLHLIGNSELAALLIERGASVNAKNLSGDTPLSNIFRREDIGSYNLDLARVLVRNGADVTVRTRSGNSLLFSACKNENLGSFDYRLALLLLKAGADVNSTDTYGNSLLHLPWLGRCSVLTMTCKPVIAQYLVEKGVDPNSRNKRGETPLHMLLAPEAIIFLVGVGARLDAVDREGNTPLHAAARRGLDGNIPTLLKLGASPNSKNNAGQTPLHIAAAADLSAALLLIQAGADIEARDKLGRTPLFYAGNTFIAEWMIKSGATPNVKDLKGLTPADAASSPEIRAFFRAHIKRVRAKPSIPMPN